MEKATSVSVRQLERYPIYLKYLISMRNSGVTTLSSPIIARAMKCSEEQVRKDFQAIARSAGKPGTGRDINSMIEDLEKFLGYNDVSDAIIVGVGGLGGAFMKFKGFDDFGLNILAGFDCDPLKVGTEINGKKIFSLDKLENLVERLNVNIAILTTPSDAAQEVCDLLVKSGIKAIWNFVPVHLNVSDDVIVENVDLASSLAILSHRLNNKLKGEI